jgi:hypothetical protein
MSDDNRLRGKIKRQITQFASRLTDGWAKPARRFVGQMLYGLQAAEDVKVSNIARSLNESVRLIKTENRLCRNLARQDLTDRINRFLVWEGAGVVDADTVLALDLGDLRKEYAKAMEHLATVRDGSTGELAKGYWLCEVVAAHPYGERILPLYGELYSAAAEGFQSENAEMLRAIERVSQATAKRGIWTIDRGGDRRKILIPMLDQQLRFVVRHDGDRHILMPSGRKCAVKESARSPMRATLTFRNALRNSSAGKGLRTLGLTTPTGSPFSRRLSAASLAVSAAEFSSTSATSASSMA